MKVGSGDLSNLPYLRQVAALGKPIILSTGMGSTDDVRLALTAIQSTMSVPVVLLHCVSAYPAPESEMNLRCIVTLREEFGLPVGLSDHTKGSLAATVAVGLGMVMLEKHLTLDHTLKGPDHAASAEPAEFAELVRLVRRTQAMLGTGVKMPAACEVGTYAAVQRVLHYLADLPAGHVLRLEDMEALRCGLEGLSPEAATRLEGRMLRHAVRAGLLVKDEDAE
jgi:N-acetylneuraminate synthase/N,N'-diacetyllegionaminate synthase